MAKIKIATDSTADIPVEIRESLGIEVLPITIIDGEKEYKDGYDMTPQEFYEILENAKEIPSTSRVVPVLYGELYEECYKEGYTDIILTCINSKGSSTLQGAIMSKDMFYEDYPEAKEKINIHIIDSKTYSMAYGMAVIKAAEMAKDGANVDEILKEMNEWLENVRILFLPMNLKFVKKSGRVSAAAAFVGDALGLKPIITFEDGDSKVLNKIRGDKKAISTMIDMCVAERGEGTPYSLVYGSNSEAYAKLKEVCSEKMDIEPSYEYLVGAVIAINAGPDIVGIIYRKK
ncbi:MAG: DegV family protein [Ruminococcaceae bacterium]|nr:DegV family protein [Oscillospiraceae bacterium]